MESNKIFHHQETDAVDAMTKEDDFKWDSDDDESPTVEAPAPSVPEAKETLAPQVSETDDEKALDRTEPSVDVPKVEQPTQEATTAKLPPNAQPTTSLTSFDVVSSESAQAHSDKYEEWAWE